MKKYLLLIAAMVMIAGTSCQKKVDIEKEKEAIMAVIKAESETARAGDAQGLMSCYIQDEYNTRLSVGLKGYDIITGWDQLGPHFEKLTSGSGPDPGKVTISKENPVIKVMGNTAWLICDNIWEGEMDGTNFKSENIQITFLEKADGKWKFSFAAWITRPEPPVAADTTEAGQ